jgi:hypothetical protein
MTDRLEPEAIFLEHLGWIDREPMERAGVTAAQVRETPLGLNVEREPELPAGAPDRSVCW